MKTWMKKSLSLTMALVLTLSLFVFEPLTASATSMASGKEVFTAETAVEENTVSLIFKLSTVTSSRPLRELNINIGYDSSVLTYKNCADGDWTINKSPVVTPGASSVNVKFEPDSNGSYGFGTAGTLFTLQFTINNNPTPGRYSFSIGAGETTNYTVWKGYNTSSKGQESRSLSSFLSDYFFLGDLSGIIRISEITGLPAKQAAAFNDHTVQFSVGVLPANAQYQDLYWTSSNNEVATVNSSGLVTLLKEGETTIRAEAADGSGVFAECVLTVTPGVSGITLWDVEKADVSVGGTIPSKIYTIRPATALNQMVTWSSSATETATVDPGTGVVTGIAAGDATITATTEDGGYTASYPVTVVEGKAASIGESEYYTLNEALAAAASGDTVKLLRDHGAMTVTLSQNNVTLDLNGHTLSVNTLEVPAGTEGVSIVSGAAGGTISLYRASALHGLISVKGKMTAIRDCTINCDPSRPESDRDSLKLFRESGIDLLDGCTINGNVIIGGVAESISNCTVKGAIQAVGIGSGADEYTAKIRSLTDCTVTMTGQGQSNSYAAVYSQLGEIKIGSGTYISIDGSPLHANGNQKGIIQVYDGLFKPKAGDKVWPDNTAEPTMLREDYEFSATPDSEGFYTVVPGQTTGTFTLTVTPADAVVVVKDASNAVQSPLLTSNAAGGVYRYELVKKSEYTYSVSKSGMKTQSGPVRLGDRAMLSVSIALEQAGAVTPVTPGAISGGTTITSGGTYTIQSGATGTILVMTKEPVTLVGSGISSPDSKFSDLTFDCSVAGANLTLKDIWINNNVGRGTASGDVNFGLNIINFTGKGNQLNVEGESLLETQEYVQGAGIHVPKGADLFIGGSGTLYLYKYSQGAGIGGNSYEACGTITFGGADVFIKGSKTGPLVGGDSLLGGVKNDPVYITGGTLVLINKANGAAIGASKQGKGAGPVYLQNGNLTIISDFLGSAIGYGGDRSGSAGTLYVSGGSFKAVRTDNSLKMNSDSAAQTVDDTLVTATKRNGSDTKAVSRLIFDTSMLSKKANGFDVSGSTGFTYSGGFHEHRYTESTTSTVSNFGYDGSDKNLYFYLPMETQTLTVNNEKFQVTWSGAAKAFTVKKADPNAPVINTPEAQKATVTAMEITPTTNGTVSTATVTSSAMAETLTKALKAAEEAGTSAGLEIKVNAPSTATEVRTSIPTASISSAVDASIAMLSINTPVGTVELNAAALSSAVQQAGSNASVTVTVRQVSVTALSADQQKLVSGGAVVEVSMTAGSQSITRLGGGSAAITVPAGTVKDGQTARVYYLNSRGRLILMTGSYNVDSGTVTYSTSHLSKYVVLAQEKWESPFEDVANTAWCADAVEFAAVSGLFQGTSDTAFSPNASMTRAMLVSVLWRMEGKPASDKSAGFGDVAADAWYADAVNWAAANDIVGGYAEGVFGPSKQLSRQQLAAILARFAKYCGYDVTGTADLSGFTDQAQMNGFAKEGMAWAVNEGLISGTTAATLAPAAVTTRAQVATILMRFQQKAAI
ncbi:S-layer homology domain-containing protein [Oscillibacter sp.]|uniref:S-layer homology domain-containing protein n=1 Tax=Oscillibacter sp. TaxID=1945593 RepID=UPI00289EB842|nr:S-layer homology domain-containing protein [Oscillibacter sp.]